MTTIVAQFVNGLETRYTLDVAASLEQVLVEQRSDVATTYLYGLGRIAYRTGTAEWSYYLADGLGNVRAEVSAAGVVLTVRRFSPFGEPLQGGDGGTPFGYTGEQWDASAGLLYLRARYYSPGVGRFVSKDPFPGLSTIPQSLHPYAYAFNNPVNLTDPSGRFVPLLVPLILGGAIGGGFAAVAYMQAHPCADFWSDRDFQRTVGVGILAGMAGAAVGLTMGLIGVPGGLGGAIVYGMIVGSASGVATQMTANALTERPLHEGVLEAAVVGAASGGLFAGIGYGVGKVIHPTEGAEAVVDDAVQSPQRRVQPSGIDGIDPRPLNSQGVPYPSVIDLRTGDPIPFPKGNLVKTAKENRVTWGLKERGDFIAEWYRRGYSEPSGGWKEYDIHHIHPREYGGTNDFDNLASVKRGVHQNEFNAFWRDW